jgi:hypothetical protein
MARMTDNSRRTGAAIEAHYRFLAWLMPTNQNFLKRHRFTIRDQSATALGLCGAGGGLWPFIRPA